MMNSKLYKVLRLTLANKDALGLEKLIAELSEVEVINIEGLSHSHHIFSPSNSEYFIFLADSSISKKIISNPEIFIELNLNDFEVQQFQIDNTLVNKAYFHYEYIKSIEKAFGSYETEIKINYSLQNCIEECLLRYHTDMYFTYLIRLIIYCEYEMNGNEQSIDTIEVFNKYKKLCSYILFKTCNIQTPEYYEISSQEALKYEQNYRDVINYGKLFINVISTYVQYRDTVRKIIMQNFNDKEPTYPLFCQACMLEGYKIALSRTENSLNSKDYYSHEIIQTQNSKVLKLYPTLTGFQNKNYILNLIKDGGNDTTVDSYFSKYNIVRIHDEQLKQELKTKYIFKVPNESGIFYYKRRPLDDEYVPFGEQDRKNPFKSLFFQGQINLIQKI